MSSSSSEFYLDDSDSGSFEIESGSSSDIDDPAILLENYFHESKSKMDDRRAPDDELATEAMEGFKKVLELEDEQGSRSELYFDSLCYLLKLHFDLGQTEELKPRMRQVIDCTGVVTRNQSERAIVDILDYVSRKSEDMNLIQELYELTLASLKADHKLWFKVHLKLGNVYFKNKEFGRLQVTLRELYTSCQDDSGAMDPAKGAQLLEAYALEIQMHTETKDNKRLKKLYEQSLLVSDTISHPKVMGIIRECGGKMHMNQGIFGAANADFFEAFKSYDNASDRRATDCLKYYILSNMLMESGMSPFADQSTRAYQSAREIQAFSNLVQAYQRDDLDEFQRVLRVNRRSFSDDAFLSQYVEVLVRNIRTNVIVRLIRPYTNISIKFIADEINTPVPDVESLIISLILDNRINGKIDQIQGRLIVQSRFGGSSEARYQGIAKWTDQLERMTKSIEGKF